MIASFAPLRRPAFRLLWGSRLVSATGFWMDGVTTGWLGSVKDLLGHVALWEELGLDAIMAHREGRAPKAIERWLPGKLLLPLGVRPPDVDGAVAGANDAAVSLYVRAEGWMA